MQLERNLYIYNLYAITVMISLNFYNRNNLEINEVTVDVHVLVVTIFIVIC